VNKDVYILTDRRKLARKPLWRTLLQLRCLLQPRDRTSIC